jgi:hypothetical protein
MKTHFCLWCLYSWYDCWLWNSGRKHICGLVSVHSDCLQGCNSQNNFLKVGDIITLQFSLGDQAWLLIFMKHVLDKLLCEVLSWFKFVYTVDIVRIRNFVFCLVELLVNKYTEYWAKKKVFWGGQVLKFVTSHKLFSLNVYRMWLTNCTAFLPPPQKKFISVGGSAGYKGWWGGQLYI